MEPNLTVDLQACLERLIDSLSDDAQRCPMLRFYTFSYENGKWAAKLKITIGEPDEAYYERNLRKLLDYIEQHCSGEITECLAAGIIGLSISEFCRFFKKQTGCSFVEYKNKVRIGHAARKLLDTGLSCEQVGLDCGFSSYGYFRRVFEREYGLSPREYRRVWEAVPSLLPLKNML